MTDEQDDDDFFDQLNDLFGSADNTDSNNVVDNTSSNNDADDDDLRDLFGIDDDKMDEDVQLQKFYEQLREENAKKINSSSDSDKNIPAIIDNIVQDNKEEGDDEYDEEFNDKLNSNGSDENEDDIDIDEYDVGDDDEVEDNEDDDDDDGEAVGKKRPRDKEAEKVTNMLLNLADENMQERRSDPSLGDLSFLRYVAPEVKRRLDMDPDRQGMASIDSYAFMANAPVPQWSPNKLPLDKQIRSYEKQILSNEGDFAFNFDPETKRAQPHVPYFIYNVANLPVLFDGHTKASEIKKEVLKGKNYIKDKGNIVIMPMGKMYDALPMEYDGVQFNGMFDKETQMIGPAIPEARIAVPVKLAQDFEDYLWDNKDKIQSYQAHMNTPLIRKRKNAFLISKNTFPQTIHNFTTSKGEGLIGSKKMDPEFAKLLRKHLKGGRNVYSSEQKRNDYIALLKAQKNLSPMARARKMPYSLAPPRRERTLTILQHRLDRLPKYVQKGIPRSDLEDVVSDLHDKKTKIKMLMMRLGINGPKKKKKTSKRRK